MSNETKKTAAERIQNLEETMLGSLKALNAVNSDNETIKEALRLLANKLDSVIKLLNEGKGLSDTNISTVMVQNKADQLASNTAAMVENGVLVKADTVENNSFIVGREVEDSGVVTNPRIQFTLESAKENLKANLLGAKVLDRILVQEGKAKLEILEIYSINQPVAPPAPQEETQVPQAEPEAPQAQA
jgi:hypothetical protein